MTSIYGAGFNRQYWNDTPLEVKLIIHSQFSGIELVSPKHASDGAKCLQSPGQSAYVSSTMQVGFNINFSRKEPIGISMYQLKRKNKKQFNKDAISSEDETSCTQLIVIWKVNNFKEFRVVSRLIEHDKGRTWDIDNLMKLAKWYQLYDTRVPIEYAYLVHDNIVLITRVCATREKEYYKLEMTIFEGSTNDGIWKPRYIGLKG
jgi:hypothetical protein